jgi:hypothetical protein
MFEAEARQSENHINNLSYRQNSVANEYNVNFYTDYDLLLLMQSCFMQLNITVSIKRVPNKV